MLRVVYVVQLTAFTGVKPSDPAMHILSIVFAPFKLACSGLDEGCLVAFL